MKVKIEISEEGWQNFLSFMEERDSDIDLEIENFGLLKEMALAIIRQFYK